MNNFMGWRYTRNKEGRATYSYNIHPAGSSPDSITDRIGGVYLEDDAKIIIIIIIMASVIYKENLELKERVKYLEGILELSVNDR